MLIIVGPSASGKTRIVQELVKNYGLKKIVTYTTRLPRYNETNAVDYNFISKEEFFKKAKENFFLETVNYNDSFYGTSYSCIDDQSVVILEPNGLKEYINKIKNQIFIVYLKTSLPVLKIRMNLRKDSDVQIKARIWKDQTIFTEEVENLANIIIDTTPSNVYSDALTIFIRYQKFLQDRK